MAVYQQDVYTVSVLPKLDMAIYYGNTVHTVYSQDTAPQREKEKTIHTKAFKKK